MAAKRKRAPRGVSADDKGKRKQDAGNGEPKAPGRKDTPPEPSEPLPDIDEDSSIEDLLGGLAGEPEPLPEREPEITIQVSARTHGHGWSIATTIIDGETVHVDRLHLGDDIERAGYIDGLIEKRGCLAARRAELIGLLMQEAAKQSAPPEPHESVDESFAELLETATGDLECGPYRMGPGGIWLRRNTAQGPHWEQITNWAAKIMTDVERDDGVETRHEYLIEAEIGHRRRTVRVPAEQFSRMEWPATLLGAEAIVSAGASTRDHARAAIQWLSQPRRHMIYTHTGWRGIGEGWVYLHAGGAIGAAGAVEEIKVELATPLQPMLLLLPSDAEEERVCVRASLALMNARWPADLTAPLLAATYRAVLGSAALSVFLAGRTGVFKSELAALMQQHFGAGFTARALPASWSSTDNALEDLCFAAQDAVLVIDDFVATSGSDVQRLHSRADRVLRAVGNRSGRQRMRADGTLRPPRPPRCLALCTGEDVPRGHSLRARTIVLEVGVGAIDPDALSAAQRLAADGVYTRAMAGYLRWLAPRYDAMRSGISSEQVELRDLATREGQHRRTPDICAALGVGVRWWLKYAVEIGAVSKPAAAAIWDRAWQAILAAGDAQAVLHEQADPTKQWVRLLGAAIASGRAYLASFKTGAKPEHSHRWGWRSDDAGMARAPGTLLGWVDGTSVYLIGEAAHAVVQELARAQGDAVTLTLHTLHRRLHEQGYLASIEETDSERRFEIRVRIQGVRKRVLHLRSTDLAGGEDPVGERLGVPSSDAQVGPGGPDGPAVGPPEPASQAGSVASGPLGPLSHGEGVRPCRLCRSTTQWRPTRGRWTCATCHPPHPDLVAEWKHGASEADR